MSDAAERPFPAVLAPLAWLGRQGAWPLAASLAGGFLLSGLAAPLRPFLAPLVILVLAIALARVSGAALTAAMRRPVFLATSAVWLLVGLPLLAAGIGWTTGWAAQDPDLALIVVAGLASAPVMSLPAYALLLGLPSAATIALLVVAMTLLPVTLPAVLSVAVGPAALALDPLALALRLGVLLAISAALGLGLRRTLGAGPIARLSPVLDGASHVLLLFLAIILVGGFAADLRAQPADTLWLAALCCAVSIGAMAVTALVAPWLPGVPAEDRAGLSLAAGTRNLALVLAAAPDLPSQAIAYVGAAQVPIYLAPLVLGLAVRRRA